MVDLKNERIQLQALENLFRQKRFSEALTFAQKLIGDFPNSYYIGILHVKVLKELNRLRDAETAALKMMQSSPDNINLLSELGTISLKLNKYEESYDYFNKVLFQDPFNEEARDSMEKIKGLKKLSGGSEPKGKNLMDFISHPQADNDEADTVPELDGETLSPLDFGVRLEPMEPEEAPAAIESMETLEAEDLEPAESPTLPPMIFEEGQGPETDVVDISQLEEAPEMADVVELAETTDADLTEAADVVDAAEIAEIAEITEMEGMAEIPEVGDVAAEVDFMNSQAAEPYSEFYNEETVESAEEPPPLEVNAQVPVVETTQATALGEGEPGPATEFVTESAAELYLSQGLYDDALGIYEKLYAARKEGRFLLRVKQLKAHRLGREKIRRLSEFLKLIQMKGA
ncbi:MAG: hypothetical protein QG657_4012 [Acidobacteriota bacterium]|nr:hypothetical protein [Acidobacteriota bacterium]